VWEDVEADENGDPKAFPLTDFAATLPQALPTSPRKKARATAATSETAATLHIEDCLLKELATETVGSDLVSKTVKKVLRKMVAITESRQLQGRYLPSEETVYIAAGASEQRVFELGKGMALDWRWHLEQIACDVGFSACATRVDAVRFRSDRPNGSQVPSKSSDQGVSIVPTGSAFPNGKIIRGQWACQDENAVAKWQVVLTFDNSYSKFRSKTILLRTHMKAASLCVGLALGNGAAHEQRLQVQASRRCRRRQVREECGSSIRICDFADGTIDKVLRKMVAITQSRQLQGRYLPQEETVCIAAGASERRVFELGKGMALDWRWHLEQIACDVGFSACATRVAGSPKRAVRCLNVVGSPKKAVAIDGAWPKSVEEVSIVPPGSAFPNGQIVRGQWACQDNTAAEWHVVLTFDNTYSKFRSKTILLKTHMKAANLGKGAVGQRLQVQASRRWRMQQIRERVPSKQEDSHTDLDGGEERLKTPRELFAEGEACMFGTLKRKHQQQQAVALYLRAAQGGYAPAAAALGICYTDGVGVEKDVVEGTRWYMRAMEEYNLQDVAEQGDAAAQCELGDMYFYGEGVDQDKAQAVLWMTKAAAQGHTAARFFLDHMIHAPIGAAANAGAGQMQQWEGAKESAPVWYGRAPVKR
jgi:hypothetical protein